MALKKQIEEFLEQLLNDEILSDDERVVIQTAEEALQAEAPLFFLGVPVPPNQDTPVLMGLKRVIVESNASSAAITSIASDAVVVNQKDVYFKSRLVGFAQVSGIPIITTKPNRPPKTKAS